MRLVAGVLALSLFAPFVARAEEPATPAPAEAPRSRVPLRVVRVMPESRQALLFDRERSTHVLAELGGKIEGYTVDAIDDDEVVLSRDGKEVVLAAPARAHASHHTAAKQSDSAAPVDPYAEGPVADGEIRSASASEPAQPGASPDPSAAGAGSIRVAHAPTSPASRPADVAARPIEPGADGVRVAEAPIEPSAIGAPSPAPVRVAEAPAPSASPAAPAITPSSPPVASASPAAPAITPSSPPIAAETSASLPVAVELPASAPPTSEPTPRIASPSPSADARALNAAIPDHPTRGKPARAAKAPRTAANKQTADALALADIMSADTSPRSPRGPAPASLAETAQAAAPTANAPTANAPAANAPAATASAPAAATSAPSVAPSPAPSATSEARTAAPAAADVIVLPRRDVDGALADFARLTTALHASFAPTGVVITDVARGSLFERAGLRAGDTITAVDGAHLRSLDDAANLYARASTASALTVQLLRNARPVTLRVVIQ